MEGVRSVCKVGMETPAETAGPCLRGPGEGRGVSFWGDGSVKERDGGAGRMTLTENVGNATEPHDLRWLIRCYVNFASTTTKRQQVTEQEQKPGVTPTSDPDV